MIILKLGFDDNMASHKLDDDEKLELFMSEDHPGIVIEVDCCKYALFVEGNSLNMAADVDSMGKIKRHYIMDKE